MVMLGMTAIGSQSAANGIRCAQPFPFTSFILDLGVDHGIVSQRF
jgi:hypothetical protein